VTEAADLSVVIPTRDRWAILARTLDALGAQTARGFETILAVDGEDQRIPEEVHSRPGTRVLTGPRGGPGLARNRGVQAAERPVILFLGDDMVPTPALVARHLDHHRREPGPELAVLGHVEWHPEVADDRLLRWLDWSGSQFDYRSLAASPPGDAGFGRFYASNVSLKRAAFLGAGGFDPDFGTADYEDLDLGWRLYERGMRLRYEPGALAYHLHDYGWTEIERRYSNRARAERLMLSKHDWFEPWFYNRIRFYASKPRVARLWPLLADRVVHRTGPASAWTRERADRWYHQRLAPAFLSAWEDARARQ
jgi:GT2 family glycosyltransferase